MDERNLDEDKKKTGAALIEAMHDIISEAITGIVTTGKDLGASFKNLTIATLKGVGSIGEESYSAIGALSSLIVKTTYHAGGDVISASQGLVSGVIYSYKNLGIEDERAVSEAATEAVKVGYEISAEVGDRIKRALIGTIEGVKVVFKEGRILC